MSYPIVYDLCYPSPATLREIVENKIVIELWRQEIHKQRIRGTLNQLNFEKSVSSSILHPYIPSSFLDIIDKKIDLVGKSIKRWIDCYTYYEIFPSHVLRDFDDFVCDFDGSIDYGKTAKRMMVCNEISQVSKFKIACLCCFEDDIALLWTSVSSQFHLRDINSKENRMLFYWVCRLRNQMYKMPLPSYLNSNENHDESVFSNIVCYCSYHWSSLEYFFNRNSNTRENIVNKILKNGYLPEEFYRYLLAKLNEEELSELLTTDREALYNFLHYDRSLIFWMHVKNRTTEDDFVSMIRTMLYDLARHQEYLPEIWINAPDNFKQSALQRVLFDTSELRQQIRIHSTFPNYQIRFLLIAFRDASLHDRFTFWNENWVEIIKMIRDTNELQQLMAMCFENENEVIQYKKTVMSNFERIREYCQILFCNLYCKKLNNVLNFCFIEEQNIRLIKLQLLNEDFHIYSEFFKMGEIINEFINDAYNDTNSATEFKNQFLSRATVIQKLEGSIYSGSLKMVREFIETLSASEPAVKHIKRNVLLPALKKCLIGCTYLNQRREFDYQNFLHWCLENDDDDIAEFKQTISADAVVQAVMRREMQRLRNGNPVWSHGNRDPMSYHPQLIEFLKWYFVTPEAYENFAAKYADDEEFVQLTTQTVKEC